MFEIDKPEDFIEDNNGFNYKDYIIKHSAINKDVEDFVTGRIPHGFPCGISELDNHFLCKKNTYWKKRRWKNNYTPMFRDNVQHC